MKPFFLSLLIPFFVIADAYVTYEVSGGRFGDHLSDYFHGRWVEYKMGVPLLYEPFAFSDALVLHKKKARLKEGRILFDRTIECHREEDVVQNLVGEDQVLFWIPHFTGFSIDSVINVPFGRDYFPKCFLVDWRDKQFLKILREEISPLSNSVGLFRPEAGFLSIALHYRDGGGVDRPEWQWQFPLRFPPKQFYKKSLGDLISALPSEPLFIGIFTDSRTPKEVRDEFAQFVAASFPSREIKVVLSSSSRGDGAGVLEDFFSIETFKYVIGGESLYSQNAARLGDCRLSIRPQIFVQDSAGANLFAPTLIDMQYKTASDDQMLSFQPEGEDFASDLQEILRRAWYCHQNGLYFDLTMPHPLYERLNFAFLKPLVREGEMGLVDFPAFKEIDWADPLFLMTVRSFFVPKMNFKLSINKTIPSVAILDTVENLEPYVALVGKNGWKKHQVTLVFTTDVDTKTKSLGTTNFQKKLKKLGVQNVEINSFSISKDPLEAFVALGFYDHVFTTPSVFVETATKIFNPQPAIVVK